MKDEMYNWIFLCAGMQKLTRALWTRSKKLEVFNDDDNHNDGHSDEDHSDGDGDDGDISLAGLAWAFQCDVSKREEVAEMAR